MARASGVVEEVSVKYVEHLALTWYMVMDQ